MKVIIKGSDDLHLSLFPTDERQDIIQNIQCILRTTQGSCPNLRNYGLGREILHKPTPVAKAGYSVAISKQIAKYEPRAVLKSIDFWDDPNCPEKLNPVLEVIIP